MKIKLTLLAVCASIALVVTGCKTTPQTTQAIVQSTVATGVMFGVQKAPDAIPYLRAAAPVICSAANGTNLSPNQVVAALESSQAAALKTPTATLIINGALSLYMVLWDQYGSEYVKNTPLLQSYLVGTCNGITEGLPPTSDT